MSTSNTSDGSTRDPDDAGQLSRKRQGLRALAVGAVGVIGLLRGADSVNLLAWLTLAAPALGALAGGLGVRFWPAAWVTPGLWGFLLIQTELSTATPLPSAGLGLAVVVGLFLIGLGLGQRFGGPSPALAGVLLLLTMALSTAALWGGLGDPGSTFGRHHPALGLALLETSPLVVVLESAGLDWTHSQPHMYARGGVEWIPRATHRGALAGPVVLLVGSLVACLAQRRGRPRQRES